MAFLPPRSNFDQVLAEEFGETAEPQSNPYTDAQARENRILSSVENRLQKANYYRLVLDNPLFSDGETEVAYEVEAEFRNFALERLQILMGERPERSELDVPEDLLQVLSSFTPIQLQATKLWAERLIERDPSIRAQTPPSSAPPAAPKLNPVTASAPPAPSLNVVKAERKPRPKKPPKIEPRKPSPLVAAAQQARQTPQPVQQPVIQPRVPPRQPIVEPAPQLPAPDQVLHHFQSQDREQAPEPVQKREQPPPQQRPQPPAPQQQQGSTPPSQSFNTQEENDQAMVNSQGGLVDHLGRGYEIKEYVDHRTGEIKKHKVFFNSQVFPKGQLAKDLYQVPNEKAAFVDLMNKDTQGASMIVRTGPNPWDKTLATTAQLGLGGAITHFQVRNRNVQEE